LELETWLATMVKADVSRDYYADLEIHPTASEEDIKKAFRNLGI
jgi:curved DNA-binding protein CbpA